MPRFDLVGQNFGRWQVLEYVGDGRWRCRCACGTEGIHRTGTLRIGHTNSCMMCEGMNGRGRRRIDMTGQRCGRLVVIEPAQSREGEAYWLCQCDCGNVAELSGYRLRRGHTKSCGCLARQSRRSGAVKHRRIATTEYRVWAGMLARCNNERSPAYHNYGGRGITVCERWQSFEGFFSDMGERPSPKYTLDRIDNDGNYEPGNCRWATYKTQARNTRTNRRLAHGGQALTLVEWSEQTGMRGGTIANRLALGWSVERALTEPLRPSRRTKQRVRSSAPASAGHPAADPADPQPVPTPSPGVA